MKEIYIKNKNTAGRLIKGNAYVIVPEDNMMYMLNHVGSFLWNQLSNPCTVDDMAAKIHKEYDVSKEKAKKDAKEFLNNLVSFKVIVKENL